MSQGSKVSSFFETFVPTAAGVIYGVGFVTPLVMIIIMRCFGAKNSYITALCIILLQFLFQSLYYARLDLW